MRQERLERTGRPASRVDLRDPAHGNDRRFHDRIDEAGLAFLERVRSLSPRAQAKVSEGSASPPRSRSLALAPHAHAVVVGSALVREIMKGGDIYKAVRAKMEELAGLRPARS